MSIRPLEEFFYAGEAKMVEVTVRNESDSTIDFRNQLPWFHGFTIEGNGDLVSPSELPRLSGYRVLLQAVSPKKPFTYFVCLDPYLDLEASGVYELHFNCFYHEVENTAVRLESDCSFVVDVRAGAPREALISSYHRAVSLDPYKKHSAKKQKRALMALDALFWTDHPMAIDGLIEAYKNGFGSKSEIKRALFKFIVDEVKHEGMVEVFGYEDLFSRCRLHWHKPSPGYLKWLNDRGSVEERIFLLEFVSTTSDPVYWDVVVGMMLDRAGPKKGPYRDALDKAVNTLNHSRFELDFMQR